MRRVVGEPVAWLFTKSVAVMIVYICSLYLCSAKWSKACVVGLAGPPYIFSGCEGMDAVNALGSPVWFWMVHSVDLMLYSRSSHDHQLSPGTAITPLLSVCTYIFILSLFFCIGIVPQLGGQHVTVFFTLGNLVQHCNIHLWALFPHSCSRKSCLLQFNSIHP